MGPEESVETPLTGDPIACYDDEMLRFDVSNTYYSAEVGPYRWETIGTLEAASLDDAVLIARATYPGREVIVSAQIESLPAGRIIRRDGNVHLEAI